MRTDERGIAMWIMGGVITLLMALAGFSSKTVFHLLLNKLDDISNTLKDISKSITEHNTLIEDHERRITRLEEKI